MISCAESMQHELDAHKEYCPDIRRERVALQYHVENQGYTLLIPHECDPELAGAGEEAWFTRSC